MNGFCSTKYEGVEEVQKTYGRSGIIITRKNCISCRKCVWMLIAEWLKIAENVIKMWLEVQNIGENVIKMWREVQSSWKFSENVKRSTKKLNM